MTTGEGAFDNGYPVGHPGAGDRQCDETSRRSVVYAPGRETGFLVRTPGRNGEIAAMSMSVSSA
jgi:hypothetical protein